MSKEANSSFVRNRFLVFSFLFFSVFPILSNMKKLCFLDLETTGFDPEKDSIIEVSFLVFESGKKTEEIDQVLIPDKSPLTDFISNLTGIFQEEIDTAGKNFSEIKDEIIEKIGDGVIVGHNIDFDINFLVSNGIPIENNPRIDTHELARIMLPQEESFALEVLTQKYGFAHESAHRAMSDVLASKKLFEFICEKIDSLPKEFLEQIKEFLETKTDWYAKTLFLNSIGSNDFVFEKSAPKKNQKEEPPPISNNFKTAFNALSPKNSIFLKIGDATLSANFCESITQEFVEIDTFAPEETTDGTLSLPLQEKNIQKNKFLIISPKLDFFPRIKKFPTPEVLFDIKNLENFLKERTSLDFGETTFYLKCKFRHFLGFRGLHQFDLFFKENDFWSEIHCQNTENPIFQEILEERKSYNTLAITPNAFLRFHDLECFQDRILIIDEAELFAEELLFAPAKKFSLQRFLNTSQHTSNLSKEEKENLSVTTQFFITHFCKEVIETKIQRQLSRFPEKILLNETETFPQFQENLETLAKIDPQWTFVAENFNQKTKQVRWVNYFPESGNLMFGFWHPDDWRKLKNKLTKFRKIFCHRHEIVGEDRPFFRIFVGANTGISVQENLFSSKKLIIPKDLVSQNSPEFNDFCAKKITTISRELLTDPKSALAVNFSSLETLRNIFTEVNTPLKKEGFIVFGEKASGGDGKVRELLEKNKDKPSIFFYQKMCHPNLEHFQWEGILIQKFPFSPPRPLLKKMEEVIKSSGQDFWKLWIIPQIAANLSRRISCFPSSKKIIFLDPRENASWGKNILKSAFGGYL